MTRLFIIISLFSCIILNAQNSDFVILKNGERYDATIKSVTRKTLKAKLANGKKVKYSADDHLVREFYWKDKNILYRLIKCELSYIEGKKKNSENEEPKRVVYHSDRFLPVIYDSKSVQVFMLYLVDSKNRPYKDYFISKDDSIAKKIPDATFNLRPFVNEKNVSFFRELFIECPQIGDKFKDDTKQKLEEFYSILDQYNEVCPKQGTLN